MLFDTVQQVSLSDFDYHLPPEQIAQYPAPTRDGSRLMVVDRRTGEFKHDRFKNFIDYLRPDDVLVFNNTRVFPSRLFAKKDKTDTEIELFLLRELGHKLWEALVKPARKVRVGNKLVIGGELVCDVVDNTVSGGRVVRFNIDGEQIYEALDRLGTWPLPPYIKRPAEPLDRERYQTVYAQHRGAVAAPTAGLHFTEEILNAIKEKGVEIHYILLHVGLGTFRPVQVEDITKHHMDSEYYEVSPEVARALNEAKQAGRRIIAVGTTVVRALESAVQRPRGLIASSGWTDKFIYPPYDFKMVDALLTNFHQPKSTLLMLVSAFAGTENILRAYNAAVKEGYRFFSYGDAMFLQ